MCKLLCILDIENEDLALEFSELAVKPMTSHDNDGLGMIMLGDEGLGVERWLKPDQFPNIQTATPEMSKWSSLLPVTYNNEGNISQRNIYALGVHARMATGAKTLENVHPFCKDGLALIHNGVISNHDRWNKTLSTCDSEALLSLYLEHDVRSSLANVQRVCDDAMGWYAFMVFNERTKSIDIIKDAKTSLLFSRIPGMGTVFCTMQEIIKNTCGRLKIKQPEVYSFPGDTAIRWTLGAKEIETYQIESVKYLSSFTDVSRPSCGTEEKGPAKLDDEKCEHGIRTGFWCAPCYHKDFMTEDKKDMPLLGGI